MSSDRFLHRPELLRTKERIATSVVLAEHRIDNEELAEYFNFVGVKTSKQEPYTAERILSNTGGIISRYHRQKLGVSTQEQEDPSMAEKALNSVLEQKGWEPDQIDALVYVSSYEGIGPENLAEKLRIPSEKVHDIQAACAGSAIALRYVNRNIPNGQNVVILADESDYSKHMFPPEINEGNVEDLKSLMFFSDAAASLAFTKGEDVQVVPLIDEIRLPSDAIKMPAKKRPNTKVYVPVPYAPNFKMDGPEVAKAVRRYVTPAILKACRIINVSGGRTYLIPHQANGKMLEYMQKEIEKERLKVHFGDSTVKLWGNTAGASCIAELHYLLAEEKTSLNRWDRIVFAAFGAGLEADIGLLLVA